MAVVNAVEIVRDFAGLAALALLALLAALLWTGAAGVTASLAAGVAGVAAGALGAIAFYGLFGALAGLGGGGAALIGAVLLLVGGFLTAQYLGVRGFWVFSTLALGAFLGAGLVWLFARGATAPIGPFAPLLAAAVLLFVVFGALGAVKTALAGAPEERRLRFAAADLAKPPAWFDCAYATLGGAGEAPGRCRFTPPEVDASPEWASDLAAPSPLDLAMAPDARRSADRAPAPGLAAAPDPGAAPAAADVSTPSFETEPLETATAPRGAPDAIAAPQTASDAADARRSDSSQDRADPVPSAPEDPAALGSAATPDAPARAPNDGPATVIGAAAPLAQAAGVDAPLTPPQSFDRSRARSVCFSGLAASTERLCPDQTLSERDLEVAWRDADGQAIAAVGAIECYFDPTLALHAVVLVNLSGALTEPLPNGPVGAGSVRRADAVRQMVTRMVGSARGGGLEEGDVFYVSLYFAGGSPLRAPWAEQAFGAGQVDRIFDIRSPRQTLALMRAFRAEVEALGPGALRGDLASAIDAAIQDMPAAPFEFGERLILLVIDSADAAQLDDEAAVKLGETAAASGALIFAIEIGDETGAEGPRLLAERSGGAHYRARSAAELEAIVDRALRRARSFCAVRVTAPESFFESGSVELRLRRELDGACVLEQVAVIDCDGVSASERILPADL